MCWDKQTPMHWLTSVFNSLSNKVHSARHALASMVLLAIIGHMVVPISCTTSHTISAVQSEEVLPDSIALSDATQLQHPVNECTQTECPQVLEHVLGEPASRTLAIEPVGLEVDGRRIRLHFVAQGPTADLQQAVHAIVVACIFDPASWIELQLANEDKIITLQGMDARTRVQVMLPKSNLLMFHEGRMARLQATVWAHLEMDLEPQTLSFRIKPDAPFDRRLRSVGSVNPHLQVRANTAWFEVHLASEP